MIALIANKPDINTDNWLYIHDETVKVGRIQNFKNWSPDLVPDASTTCLGMEYFCNKNDDFWNLPDNELIDQAQHELSVLGLADAGEITDAKVVRVEQAYPVYDAHFQEHVNTVRAFLDKMGNLQLIGRNGMHKYNNQDHAMMTAMLAVKNIKGGTHNIWDVNISADYGEEK